MTVMLIKVDLDNSFLGESIAWVTTHPGCYSEGRDASEVILRVPQALITYRQWIGKHTRQSWLEDLGDFDVRLIQALNGENAGDWFQSDTQPLNGVDTSRGLQVLAWSRADLLDLVNSFSQSELDRVFTGESLTIRGILKHMADTEFQMVDGFGTSEMRETDLSENPFERLDQTRRKLNLLLPELTGGEQVVQANGEFWSGRKLLRRAAWHERDHIQQILRYMTLM